MARRTDIGNGDSCPQGHGNMFVMDSVKGPGEVQYCAHEDHYRLDADGRLAGGALHPYPLRSVVNEQARRRAGRSDKRGHYSP